MYSHSAQEPNLEMTAVSVSYGGGVGDATWGWGMGSKVLMRLHRIGLYKWQRFQQTETQKRGPGG